MNASVTNIFVTGEFAQSPKGHVWHRMYEDNKRTMCNKVVNGDSGRWSFGQTHVVSYYASYCKKCMPNSNFRVVKGEIVR